MNTCELSVEGKRYQEFEASFFSAKVQGENDDLHKTSAYLSEQARSVERAMDRKLWEKV